MELFFDFKRDFDLKNLSPSIHAALSEKFMDNPELSLLYKQF